MRHGSIFSSRLNRLTGYYTTSEYNLITTVAIATDVGTKCNQNVTRQRNYTSDESLQILDRAINFIPSVAIVKETNRVVKVLCCALVSRKIQMLVRGALYLLFVVPRCVTFSSPELHEGGSEIDSNHLPLPRGGSHRPSDWKGKDENRSYHVESDARPSNMTISSVPGFIDARNAYA
ncbi:hypothetical protein EDC04DRAFT_2600243 [Pisolithus marmoratus]|nr:hypothetical protein EDC04DRAFT_2600243 [Pisolithus marmoratus]